jgi:hypothetical protein
VIRGIHSRVLLYYSALRSPYFCSACLQNSRNSCSCRTRPKPSPELPISMNCRRLFSQAEFSAHYGRNKPSFCINGHDGGGDLYSPSLLSISLRSLENLTRKSSAGTRRYFLILSQLEREIPLKALIQKNLRMHCLLNIISHFT